MSFVLLPTELILVIEKNLDSKRDLNALICTSRRFAFLFDGKLYKTNSKNDNLRIILWAASHDMEGTICKFLEAGATISRRDRFKSYLRPRDSPDELDLIPRRPVSHPLTAAAEAGSLSCVRFLLQYGVDPNFLDDLYETPMRQAAGNGHVDIMTLLLSQPGDPFIGSFKLRRPLKYAAARGQMRALEILFDYLESGDRGLSIKEAAHTILYEGLWHCNVDIVDFAFKNGADVNDPMPNAGLRFVSDIGPEEVPTRPRPRLVQKDKFGRVIHGSYTRGWVFDAPNALYAAIVGKNPALLTLVLSKGIDMSRRGADALGFAIIERNLPMIVTLIELGVTSEMFVQNLEHQSDSHKFHLQEAMVELGIGIQPI
ncbi:hypothetical protein N7457_008115 [Penicillium paradoxum]|uniref:uncharacterized protein n=1 Tax=Penicillium paradoxum TaxID=176176 RepID=UPI0025493CD7|nr:uncharacterized protein N7457_008115 [Penicillium paradoxum]KAJ5773219.1 hypothetical protein N7457_008115 [Penicillium paradoxum]